MVEWETAKLPKELIAKIDKFIESEFAKEYGYTSRSQAIIRGMGEFLERYKGPIHFTLKSPKLGKLKFKKTGPIVICIKCKTRVCEDTVELFKHSKLFDLDLLDDGDILSGVDFDQKIDILNPQKI